MGYYSNFEIDFHHKDEIILKRMMDEFYNLSGCGEDYWEETVCDYKNNRIVRTIETCDSIKFYNHDEVFKKLSSKYTDSIIVVEKFGEDRRDVTKTCYRDGKNVKTIQILLKYSDADLEALRSVMEG